MSSHYKIQTIPHNLSKEETIVQMVEVLDHLNAITEDIFSRVSKRLDTNSEKLQQISKRIDKASCKVDNLKGDKKAKTVFSSSKYPASDVNRDYVSIFKEPINVQRPRHELTNAKYVSTYEPLSKLQFYHVKVPDSKKPTIDGLGDIPQDVKCVNDLLLCNTAKNVYSKEFRPSDCQKMSLNTSSMVSYTTSAELGPAPLSISQRSSLQQFQKDEYFYTPQIEELPDLDVPWDLPDLPGIAQDVRYEVEANASIAPSALIQIPDMDLPDIALETITEETIEDKPPPPPPIIQTPPLPPPPPQVEPPRPQPIEGPPPPLSVPQEDSRASLMDAIRKVGGSQKANLKKVTNEEEKKKVAPVGGDLMADLHSKLQMRRKGISGIKQQEQGTVFDVLSSMIPEPSKGSDGTDRSSEDEAWNDD